jgi:tetraacyldisaccharide 4'-kinase
MASDDRTLPARGARLGLSALAGGYRLAVAGRNAMFDQGWRRPHALGRPTIAIGNLTAGGTGKTPVTLALTRRLIALGHRPAILLRGYKTAAGQSDEATLYQQALANEHIPVAAHAHRPTAADQALREAPSTDVFLLDDAFQHRQVHRDLNLVLIDATAPFGHERLLPRGLLREPIDQLKRADAVIITRADQIAPAALQKLDARIERITSAPPIAHAAHQWSALRENDTTHSLDILQTLTVAAACGIGNPTAFETTLRQHVGHLLWCQALADHAQPTASTIHAIAQRAVSDGAAALIITEKDWINWQRVITANDLPLPIYRPVLSLAWLAGRDAIDRRLQAVFS